MTGAINKTTVGRSTVVDIATSYGLDGPVIESLWGRDFSHPSRRPWDPPSLLYNGNGDVPGVKRPGPVVNHPPTSRTSLDGCGNRKSAPTRV
jgi:hypothetical protein